MKWTLHTRVTAACVLVAITGEHASGQRCDRFWIKPDPFAGLKSHGNPLAVFDDGSGPAVYAAAFDPALPMNQNFTIERWTGREWQVLNNGIPPLLNCELAVVLDDGQGPRLYAMVALPPATVRWYKWNGTFWQDPPPGFATAEHWPYCMCDHGQGPVIYGRSSAGALEQWDGSQWHLIGYPSKNLNYTMDVFDLGDGPMLYVHGQFSSIEGVPNSSGIARWDGHQWHAMGTGFVSAYTRACLFDSGNGPELYVSAGGGVRINGQTVPLVKWNGQEWVAVPFPGNAGLDQMVVFDDGSGPALVFKGWTTVLNGQPAHGFVKFNGETWQVMPGRANPLFTAEMAVFNEDPRGPSIFMYSGGNSPGLNQFVGCAGGRSCYADCDNADASPRLTANDFMCFLNRFVSRHGQNFYAHDPYTDCNQDELFNAADFQCYINKSAAGCP